MLVVCTSSTGPEILFLMETEALSPPALVVLLRAGMPSAASLSSKLCLTFRVVNARAIDIFVAVGLVVLNIL